jgi:5,5'-dehydrodivanillate O-demethylase oxygenase subunit
VLTARENELLTRIGPGTPMGALQRRYWHPVASVEEMRPSSGLGAGRWTKRVRLLGEDLVLFKDRSGSFGLIAEACPHRRASLAYGIPTDDGIRCPYHGWKFDGTGACTEQPNEPAESTFKTKAATTGYPVEVLGELIFAYLGPQPAPLLPRWPGLVGSGLIRTIGWCRVPCNWLQIMENSLDPIHTEWLHGHMNEFVREQRGVSRQFSRRHLKIDFAEFEFGIYKRRLLAGQTEESDDWKVGHPILFPNILAIGSGGGDLWTMYSYQMRIPVDDTETIQLTYTAYQPPAGADVPTHLTEHAFHFDVPIYDERGEYRLEILDIQDVMAWVSQGPIARRDLERIGTTDAGVILYRNVLKRELEKVAAGGDPLGTIRDAERNEIVFPLERNKAHFMDGFAQLIRTTANGFAPCADELVELFARYNRAHETVR